MIHTTRRGAPISMGANPLPRLVVGPLRLVYKFEENLPRREGGQLAGAESLFMRRPFPGSVLAHIVTS